MKLKEMPGVAEAAPAKMFDGRFFLTNPYDFDYTCKWNGTEYEFKAGTTSALVIPEANPLETESIRKKFAVEIGTAAFQASAKYKSLVATEKKNKGAGVPTFAPVVKRDSSGTNEVLDENSPIAPYVQKCLEPLPVVPIKVRPRQKKSEDVKIDSKTGRPIISVMSHEDNQAHSLIAEASNL